MRVFVILKVWERLYVSGAPKAGCYVSDMKRMREKEVG